MVRDPRLKLAGVALAHASGLRHLVVRLDPVVACNLRCTMCHFKNKEYVRMISVHGTTQETYERFMVGASFETIHKVLRTLLDVKSRCGVSSREPWYFARASLARGLRLAQ